jgi:hypothetical protein
VLTMDPDQLLSIRNFGPRSLTELREKLAEFGYLPEGDANAFGGGEYLSGLGLSMDGDGDIDDVADVIAALGDDDLGLDREDDEVTDEDDAS